MIPSLTSFILPGSSAAPVTPTTPGEPGMMNTPLPLVPMFMLGSSAVAPVQTPQLPTREEDVAPDSADPEQLLQLLLDPLMPMPTPMPIPPANLAQTPGGAADYVPLLTTLSPPAPQVQQQAPATLAGQVVTPMTPPTENVPGQPVKLRTPQDAREASKQVLAMMQASPDEPLAKMLPAQGGAHTQQLLGANPASTQPMVKMQAPLTLPEAAHEKAAVLREALGDRLQMQVEQRSQKATIRLDPPNLGKLDISLHYEGGKLQVQIQAAQPDVYRALQQVSQELRGALSEQNQVAVNVQISQQQQGEQRHAPRQQPTEDVVLSNNIAEVAEEQRHRDLSILTTV